MLWERLNAWLARRASGSSSAGRRLAVSGLFSITSQAVWGAQGFITFILGGRLLPQKEFGFVVAANAVLFGGQCLLLGPVTNPTLRLGALSDKPLKVTYWIYFAVTAAVCSTFVFLGAPLGRLVYADAAFIGLIRYLCIPFAATMFYAVQKLILFARMRYGTALAMDIVFMVSNISALLVFHGYGLLTSAVWFYWARSGAALLGLIPIALGRVWARPVKPRAERPFNYSEYYPHARYSFLAMLSGFGQSQMDALAVAHYLSPLAAATYGAAKVFFTGIALVTTGLTMVVVPATSRAAAAGGKDIRIVYRKALLLAYAMLIPCGAFLAIFAEPILRISFGGRYPDAVPIVRVFSVAALVMPLSAITDAVANGAGWWRKACAAAIFGGVVGSVASLLLARSLGLIGAAMAPVLALGGAAGALLSLIGGRLKSAGSVPCESPLAGAGGC